MNIFNFLQTKTIKIEELDSNFVKFKKLELDTMKIFGKCYNCDDKCNQYQYNSEAWTKIFYCAKCRCINCIIFADRMGGNHEDTIIIFKDENET